MLVRRRIAIHAAHVHAALMNERALADERLMSVRINVRKFVEEARRFRESFDRLRTQNVVLSAALERKNSGDDDEIRVAATFAQSVHRALHESRAATNRRQRIRDRKSAVVVRVNSKSRRDPARRARQFPRSFPQVHQKYNQKM